MKKYLFLFCLLAGITSCSLQDDPSADNKLNAPDLAAIATKASAINSYAQIVNGPITGLVPIDLRPPVDVIDIADSTAVGHDNQNTVIHADSLFFDAWDIAQSYVDDYSNTSDLFGNCVNMDNFDANNYITPIEGSDMYNIDLYRFMSENTSTEYQSLFVAIKEAAENENEGVVPGEFPSIEEIANSNISDLEKISLAIELGLLKNTPTDILIDEVLTKVTSEAQYRKELQECKKTFNRQRTGCYINAGAGIAVGVAFTALTLGASAVMVGIYTGTTTAICMQYANDQYTDCKQKAYDRHHIPQNK